MIGEGAVSARPHDAPAFEAVDLFADGGSQMSVGERAALEGFLARLRPELAIEIGVADGGSLVRLARWSGEVHALDLAEPPASIRALANVRFHEGSSHEQLPRLLAELHAAGRNVDFVLVDGDHTADGVRRDLVDLLDSPAVGASVLLLHDTANPEVRSGIEAACLAGYPKVAYVELDLVAGRVYRETRLRHELWGGLGLVLVDAARAAYDRPSPLQAWAYDAFPMLLAGRDALVRAADSQPGGAG